MGAMISQITSLTIVYSIVHLGANQRKHQSSGSLAFVRGIHRSPVNSPHKWPVTQKMFPFDDVIMSLHRKWQYLAITWSNADSASNDILRNTPKDNFHINSLDMNTNKMKIIFLDMTITALKIRAVYHARDLRKLAWYSKQLHLLCPPDP